MSESLVWPKWMREKSIHSAATAHSNKYRGSGLRKGTNMLPCSEQPHVPSRGRMRLIYTAVEQSQAIARRRCYLGANVNRCAITSSTFLREYASGKYCASAHNGNRSP